MSAESYRPGLEGVVATETRISDIDPAHGRIIVRGHDLLELARRQGYPQVAYLLLYGKLPGPAQAAAFEQSLAREAELPPALYELLRLLPPQTLVMDALRTGISFLAGYETPAELAATGEEADRRRGVQLLAKGPALAANACRALRGQGFVPPDRGAGYVERFLHLVCGRRPEPREVAVFDTILTCYSEHEMPNSTFAARVIASTLSDVYGAVTGAVASLKGPLHGGANEAALRMLLEIHRTAGPAGAADHVRGKLARKEKVMGFGHRVYRHEPDPRAVLCARFLPALAPARPDGPALYEIYRRVEETVHEEKGLYPNADYPIGLLFYLLDIPLELYTPIFVVARLPGLVAHISEQHAANRIFRPRARYTGPPCPG